MIKILFSLLFIYVGCKRLERVEPPPTKEIITYNFNPCIHELVYNPPLCGYMNPDRRTETFIPLDCGIIYICLSNKEIPK